MSELFEDKLKDIKIDDFSKLLKLARKYNKICGDVQHNMRIAVLGTCSIQHTVMVLRLLLLRYGIYADIYEGEYNGINMEVFDDDSNLYAFNPECVIILPDYREVTKFPGLLDNTESIDTLCDSECNNIVNIWEKIHSKLSGCQILQSNIILPYEMILGNLEGNYSFSKKSFFSLLNYKMIMNKKSYVTILDADSLSNYIGKRSWFDESSYFLHKSAFSLQYIGYYSDLIARQCASLKGIVRKCLVLDLDNTLWGGVVGDDGYDGIQLDPNDAVGEAYLAFQRYILELKSRGVILAVCSKNTEELAREAFDKNEFIMMKNRDFSSFQANWDDKVTNIRRIANELNIGLDSLVFFDDNPTERELVKQFLPQVLTIEVPEDPAYYLRSLDETKAFDWQQITQEDISRIDTYTENKKRDELQLEYTNYVEYLEALCLEAKVEVLTKQGVARFSQLINKSNQFNLRTQRYSEAQISDMMEDNQKVLLSISLKDKFSNYGIISCVMLQFDNENCFIDTWVMSCRVLKKDVEKLVMQKILEIATDRNCKTVTGEYIPTKKNRLVEGLFASLEFSKEPRETQEREIYILKNFEKKYDHSIKEINNGR